MSTKPIQARTVTRAFPDEKLLVEAFNGFKETEIGPIPVDWEIVQLREIAKVNYGKAKPKTQGVVPVVGSGGLYAWTESALVDSPTLVIGRKGTAGRVWLMEQPCWPSDTTFYLEWKQTVDVAFLFGYLTLNPLSGEHAKTTLPSLQRPDLENYFIPFPPLPEQRRIAHVLNTIQREIAAQDALIVAVPLGEAEPVTCGVCGFMIDAVVECPKCKLMVEDAAREVEREREQLFEDIEEYLDQGERSEE